MANLGRKGDVYVARFRYQGKEYKKSLKTTSLVDHGRPCTASSRPSTAWSPGWP